MYNKRRKLFKLPRSNFIYLFIYFPSFYFFFSFISFSLSHIFSLTLSLIQRASGVKIKFHRPKIPNNLTVKTKYLNSMQLELQIKHNFEFAIWIFSWSPIFMHGYFIMKLANKYHLHSVSFRGISYIYILLIQIKISKPVV